jgi:hypothetical protein
MFVNYFIFMRHVTIDAQLVAKYLLSILADNISPIDWKFAVTRLETAPIVARTDKPLGNIQDGLLGPCTFYVDATRQIC